MKYLIILFTSFCYSQSTVSFDSYTGSTNEEKWSTMVSGYTSGDIVEFTSGQTYNFTSIVDLHQVDGLTLRSTSTTKARLITNQRGIITRVDGVIHSADNLLIENLYFESTATIGGQGNANALINFGYGSGDNITITNCEFTAPNASTNAIKIYADTNSIYSNLTFTDNYIHSMGRMGIETVNHRMPVAVNRIFNIVITGNRIEDVGEVIYGMGVSLSGRNTDALIENNTFLNAPTCAVELIGGLRNTVKNNLFEGTGDPFHAVRLNIIDNNTIVNETVLLEDNVSTMTGAISLIGVDGMISRNNTWTGNRNMFFQNVANVRFINDDFNLFGENPFFNGGTATALVQMFTANNNLTGDLSPNQSVGFENCNLRLRNDVGFFQIQQGTINVSCSNVYATTNSSRFNPNGTATDVSVFVNDVANNEVGDTGVTCADIGYVAASGSTIGTPTSGFTGSILNFFVE